MSHTCLHYHIIFATKERRRRINGLPTDSPSRNDPPECPGNANLPIGTPGTLGALCHRANQEIGVPSNCHRPVHRPLRRSTGILPVSGMGILPMRHRAVSALFRAANHGRDVYLGTPY
jgi:hypothetical protein